ncbi:MAG: sulfotransferase, partial [Actinomycetota bacterium]|nr:sulfotransferase [Actinomycetota bacterium]
VRPRCRREIRVGADKIANAQEDGAVNRRQLGKSLRTDFDPSLRLRARRSAFRLRQFAHLPGLVLGGRLERPIFIIGAPRSGTSLLYSILRGSSRLANWPGEAHEVWEADYHPALRGWESNALGSEDITPHAAARIRRRFFLAVGSNRRLIDKTPRNALRVPFIDALFPDATYVFLRRSGPDNVNSLINAWRTPRYRTYRLAEPHSIPGVDPQWWKFVLYPGWREDTRGPLELVCAKQWVVCNGSALAAGKAVAPGRWIDIRYEDLVDRPEAEVQGVLEGLHLPFEDDVRERARAVRSTPINIVTPPERGKWLRENPSEIESVQWLIEPMMKQLGYET